MGEKFHLHLRYLYKYTNSQKLYAYKKTQLYKNILYQYKNISTQKIPGGGVKCTPTPGLTDIYTDPYLLGYILIFILIHTGIYWLFIQNHI